MKQNYFKQKLLAIIIAGFAVIAPISTVYADNYVITPSPPVVINGKLVGDQFKSTKIATTGNMRAVINAIRIHANGADCEIQFGDGSIYDHGTDYLEVKTEVVFDNASPEDDPMPDWGNITLLGKILTPNTPICEDVDPWEEIWYGGQDGQWCFTGPRTSIRIKLPSSVTVTSTVNIKNESFADDNGDGGYGIWNEGEATINIVGGRIETTDGYEGTRTRGRVVCNTGNGKINISEPVEMLGQIYQGRYGSNYNNDGVINITGGTFTNYGGSHPVGTLTSARGYTLFNLGGKVNISGGVFNTTDTREEATAIETVNYTSGSNGVTYYVVSKLTISGNVIVNGRVVNNYPNPLTKEEPGLEMTGGQVRGIASIGGSRTSFSGGKITSNNMTAMSSGADAIVNISGGEISSNTGTAISVSGVAAGSGIVNISGGKISSNDDYAIFTSRYTTLTISGTAEITSGVAPGTDDRFAYNGTIFSQGENTAQIIINGGTITNTLPGGYAISSRTDATPQISLGGNPIINGRIFIVYNEGLTINEGFDPGQNKYPLIVSSYDKDKRVITGGAPYMDSFEFEEDPSYDFLVENNDIWLRLKRIITFNLNEATGTPPTPINAVYNSRLNDSQKPSTAGYTREGYVLVADNWYTRTGTSESSNLFVFNSVIGTVVTTNLTLYLRWRAATVSFETSGQLPAGVLNTGYSAQLTATTEQNAGGTIGYAVIGGSLPNGLTLNSATGEISGTPTVAGNFTFTVRAQNTANNNYADGIFSIETTEVPTGIKDPASNTDVISLYPNPVTDILRLKNISPDGKKVSISIFNMFGQTIYSNEVTKNETEIEVGHYNPNVYFVRIQSSTGQVTMKFIKK